VWVEQLAAEALREGLDRPRIESGFRLGHDSHPLREALKMS
jgi:hypothetical protein